MCPKKLNQPAAILFDLDGTLLDTARDLGETLNRLLAARNLPKISYQAYRPIASHGALGLLNLGLKDHFGEDQIHALRNEFLKSYEANISLHTDFFEGMSECLMALENKNIPWGVVTNKPAFLTDQLLLNYPVFKNCAVVVSGDTLTEKKPHPAPLYFACEQISVTAEDCWYIGDAKRDIEAGNRANMTTFLAAWGYTQDELPIEAWQADHIIESPLELLAFLND
ncbi:HAD family hydrolase [Gayadomonas joobiniege]|uniref:HAD family hydrolase n=1 Tax=Gayadomonas joobiniege TaxID=1234606 RepID=UPI0003708291|nr:HAD-IA family hydrolase [Gayadomonas joobiniege]